MVTSLSARAGFSPARAQSLNSSGFMVAQIVGPALAGVVVAASSPTVAMWVDAASFAISLLIVLNVVQEPDINRPDANTTYMEDLRAGFHFVWHDRFIRSMIALASVFSMVFVPLYSVLYPVYFTRLIGSTRALGLFLAVEAAGNLLGAVIYGVVGDRFSRYGAFMFSLVAWLPFFAVMLFTPPVWLILLSGFLASLVSGALNPLFNVALQVRTPESMLPRAHSMFTAGNLLAVPFGALLIGPLIEWMGVIETLSIVVAFGVAMPIACYFNPVFRELDTPVEGAAVQTPA